MADREEVLNLFRHAKGLFRAAAKLAQDEKAIPCYVCHERHTTTEPHVLPEVVKKEKDGDSNRK